jgi:hypothetical protein
MTSAQTYLAWATIERDTGGSSKDIDRLLTEAQQRSARVSYRPRREEAMKRVNATRQILLPPAGGGAGGPAPTVSA